MGTMAARVTGGSERAPVFFFSMSAATALAARLRKSVSLSPGSAVRLVPDEIEPDMQQARTAGKPVGRACALVRAGGLR